MSDKKFNKDMIGKEVVATIGRQTAYFPKKGTKGKIVAGGYDNYIVVEWPKGTVEKNKDGKYNWATSLNMVESIRKDEEMTNEEIWKMLENKMVKNGLVSKSSYFVVKPTDPPFTDSLIIKTYDCNDAHNAIAIAYRSGYERAMKGRPFKIGEKKAEEKKKSGHWEPINPDKLPKYGTKVKYSRYNGMYKKDFGREGEFVAYGKYGNGMAFSTPESCLNWMCFDKIEDCLDMWVEDDE